MHSRAIHALGLNYLYLPFEVLPDQLGSAVYGLRALGFRGASVTIPHKEQVMQYLDEIDDDAQLIGAVNTIRVEEGKLQGFNTDGYGFLTSLKEEMGEIPEGKRILLLGAGGAARSLAVHLALAKAKEITIVNRTPSRGEQLASHLQDRIGFFSVSSRPLNHAVLKEYLLRVDIVINSTSVGMKGGGEFPFPYHLLSPDHVVCDIVYTPLETELLKRAKEQHARVLPGLGMLINQGSLAFEIWTGKKFPVEVVRDALTAELAHRQA